MRSWGAWIGRYWWAPVLIAATPLLLWLLALAGWVLLLVAGALYHAVVLVSAFLLFIVSR